MLFVNLFVYIFVRPLPVLFVVKLPSPSAFMGQTLGRTFVKSMFTSKRKSSELEGEKGSLLWISWFSVV